MGVALQEVVFIFDKKIAVAFAFLSILSFLFPSASADSFTISPTSKELDISVGSFSTFFVSVFNPTNETIRINITGDSAASRFLFFDDSAEIEVNSSRKMAVGYFIPPSIPLVSFTANLTFNSTVFPVKIALRDEIPPDIQGCDMNPREQNKTKPVQVTCIGINDNINITDAHIFVDNQTFNLTKEFFTTYKGNFTLNRTGVFTVVASVDDYSKNNINITIGNISIVPFLPLQFFEKVKFGKIKLERWHSRELFRLTDEAEVEITFLGLGYLQAGNFTPLTLRLLLSDGSYSFPKPDLPFLAKLPVGTVYAEIFGTDFGNFEGGVSVRLENSVFTSQISGEIADFQVLPKIEFQWLGGKGICEGIDTGAIENSSTQCNFTFPVDFCPEGDINKCIIPAPKSAFQSNLQVQSELLSAKSSASTRAILAWVGWLMFGLVSVGFIGYVIKENW